MTHHKIRNAVRRAGTYLWESLEITGATFMPGAGVYLPEIYEQISSERSERSERLVEASDLATVQEQVSYECGDWTSAVTARDAALDASAGGSWETHPVVIGDHAPGGVEITVQRDSWGNAIGQRSVYLPDDLASAPGAGRNYKPGSYKS